MSAAELRARFASGSAEPAVIVGGFPAADDAVWQRNWSKSSRAVYKDLLELILQGGQELGPAEGAARMPAPPAWLRQAQHTIALGLGGYQSPMMGGGMGCFFSLMITGTDASDWGTGQVAYLDAF